MSEEHRIQNIDRYLAYCKHDKLTAKSTVFSTGDVSNSLFYILSGTVTVIKKDSTGRELIIAYLSQGDFFGELGIYSQEGSIRNTSVITRTACEIGEMRYDRFLELVRIYPSIMHEVDSQLAKRLETMTQRVFDAVTFNTPERVIRCLQELCKLPEAHQNEKGVQIKISRTEIAKIVGCTRESVGRILAELHENETIYSKGHTIVVYGAKK